MNRDEIERIFSRLQSLNCTISTGLNEKEILQITSLIKCAIPVDYFELLRMGVPLGRVNGEEFPNWHEYSNVLDAVQEYINDAFTFDVKENSYWHKAFGEKLTDIDTATEVAVRKVSEWPPLLPIFGHRFVPTKFTGEHAPVISLYQPTDTIMYAHSIVEYFNVEFNDS